MTKKFEIKGMNNTLKNIKAVEKEIKKEIQEAAKFTLLRSEARVKDTIKSKDIWDSGLLFDSIQTKIEVNKTELTGIIFTKLEYAAYQEFGTSKQAARPFFFDNVNTELVNLEKILKEIAEQKRGDV